MLSLDFLMFDAKVIYISKKKKYIYIYMCVCVCVNNEIKL